MARKHILRGLSAFAFSLPAFAVSAQEAAARPTSGAAPVDWVIVLETCIGGFGIVMMVLIILTLATTALNRWDTHCEEKQVQAKGGIPQPVSAAAPAQAAAAPGIDPGVQAAILASVAAVLHGRTFRVREIHLSEKPSTAWSHAGRTDIHTSHRLPKRT